MALTVKLLMLYHKEMYQGHLVDRELLPWEVCDLGHFDKIYLKSKFFCSTETVVPLLHVDVEQ